MATIDDIVMNSIVSASKLELEYKTRRQSVILESFEDIQKHSSKTLLLLILNKIQTSLKDDCLSKQLYIKCDFLKTILEHA